LKRLSKDCVERAEIAKQVNSERDILSLLDSPFIVRCYRAFRDASHMNVLMEAAIGGHLWDLMCDRPDVLFDDKPRGSAAMFYVACITGAIEHMHERHIVHRDLKLENVLIDSRGYAKVCDLGFARFVLGRTHTFLGTPTYMAPEMIDAPHTHGLAVDWWALGVMTFELLTGRGPWDYEGRDFHAPDTALHHLLAVRACQKEGFNEAELPSDLAHAALVRNFVRQLLVPCPEKRLGARGGGPEVRAHAWFLAQKFNFLALIAQDLPSPFVPALASPTSPRDESDGWTCSEDFSFESDVSTDTPGSSSTGPKLEGRGCV